MKGRTIAIFGLSAVALAVAGTLAFAHGPRGGEGGWGGRGGHKGDRGAFLAEKLGLDDKQKAALKDLKEDMRDDQESLRDQVKAKHEAMKALWTAPNPDRAKIIAATNEISALKAQMAARHVDFLFEAKKVLKPEQFTKLVDMMGKHGFGPRGHHRGGHGPDAGGRGFGPGPAFDDGDAPDVAPDADDAE